jgi:hypothetical protein
MQSPLYIASTNAKIVPELTFIPLLAHSCAMRAEKHNIHMLRKRRKGIHKSHIILPKADGVPSVVVLVAPNTLHNHMAVCLSNNHLFHLRQVPQTARNNAWIHIILLTEEEGLSLL